MANLQADLTDLPVSKAIDRAVAIVQDTLVRMDSQEARFLNEDIVTVEDRAATGFRIRVARPGGLPDWLFTLGEPAAPVSVSERPGCAEGVHRDLETKTDPDGGHNIICRLCGQTVYSRVFVTQVWPPAGQEESHS